MLDLVVVVVVVAVFNSQELRGTPFGATNTVYFTSD